MAPSKNSNDMLLLPVSRDTSRGSTAPSTPASRGRSRQTSVERPSTSLSASKRQASQERVNGAGHPIYSRPNEEDPSGSAPSLASPAAAHLEPARAIQTRSSSSHSTSSSGSAQAQSGQSITSSTTEEEKARKKHFPYLATALVLNVAIWFSLIFQVEDIQDKQSHHKRYEIIAWVVIFFVIFACVCVLIWSPKPEWIQTKRGSLAKRKFSPYPLVYANAFLCAFFVVLYLLTNAIPAYNRTEWDYHIDYSHNLTPPGFAFASGGDFIDDALAKFAEGVTTCTWPKWSDTGSSDCPAASFPNKTQNLQIDSEAYGNIDAYIFDPRELLPTGTTYTDLTNRVLLQVNLNYDSQKLLASYTPQLQQIPYIFAVVYDPRLALSDALRCGLVALTEIPAMGSNTISLSAQYITDKMGMVKPSDDQNACSKVYTDAFTLENPPYTSYGYHLSSMPTSNLEECDRFTNSTASCISQVLIRYASRVITRMESQPGIKKTDVLIFEGAIVGAIQFFMWFLGIFSL